MISACIIVKDEENNIKDCLESIKDYVTEIIINDTGSTDNTLNILNEYDCKLLQNKWYNDFALARNQCLEKATQPYILIIDADEILINPESLNHIININDDSIGGWLINVTSKISKFNHKSKLLRLFKNQGFRFKGIIHEQIASDIIEKGYTIADSSIQLLHNGYKLSQHDHKIKQERNLGLLHLALKNEPENAYYHFHLSKTYLALKKSDEAEKAINDALFFSNNSKTKAEYLKLKSRILFNMNKFSESFKTIIESIYINSNDTEAFFIAGELANQLTYYDKSLEYYIKVIENYNNSINLTSGILEIPINQIYYKIGKIHMLKNEYRQALDYFCNGINVAPNEPYCYAGASNAEYKMTNFSKALEYIDIALNLSKNNLQLIQFKKNILKQLPPYEFNATLSIAMIVKNEENMLQGALESVKEIADEIVIVDTGSTDKTIEIAQKHGAKLFNFQWVNDFSAARNESIKRCTSDWILYLDADERIVNDDEISDLISFSDKDTGGYYCIIESAHTTNNGGSEIHRGGYPRLFRNLGYPKLYFKGKIHEQISPSIIEAGYKIEKSNITISHLGYHRNIEDLEEKAKRNYKLLMEQIKNEPNNGYLWYQLGQTLGRLKLIDQSIDSLKFAIKCGLSDSIYSSACSALSQYHGNVGKFEEALIWADESLKIAPNQVYGLNLKAHALLFMKRFDDAEKYFLKALDISKNKKTLPETGFDIDVSEDVMLSGLKKARDRTI